MLWKRILFIVALFLQFIFASFAGFVVAWGVFDLGLLPGFLIATLAGVLVTVLWLWQRRLAAEQKDESARQWAWALILGQLLLLIVAVAVAVGQLYSVGMFQPLTASRVTNFERLWRAVDVAYPYFDRKPVDWDEVYTRYRPQIEATSDDEAYYQLLDNMMGELQDAHTGILPPVWEPVCEFGEVREIEGLAVITAPSDRGDKAGLLPGDVVATVDGETAADVVAQRLAEMDGASTAWQARAWAFDSLLKVGPEQPRELTVQRANSEPVAMTLQCVPVTEPPQPAAAPSFAAAERLPSGVGYIRIPSFGGTRSRVAEFDEALAELMDAPGIIIDVRGNGGGNSLLSDGVAGRFLTNTFVYGHDHFALGLPTRLWRNVFPFQVTTRLPLYAGPVAVLTDEFVMSSAEQFVVPMVDSGRAQTVGRRTGGASGNPLVFRLPDGWAARFSSADFQRDDGTSLEGVGIVPDVPVAWTVEDIRSGNDPDIAAAERLLLEESSVAGGS